MNYKLNIELNLYALIKHGVSLKPDEFIILTWAYEEAKYKRAKCLEEEDIRYFYLPAQECRTSLPILGLQTDRAIQMKLANLVKKDLLMPHHNRRGIGPYFAFTPLSKRIFNDTTNI